MIFLISLVFFLFALFLIRSFFKRKSLFKFIFALFFALIGSGLLWLQIGLSAYSSFTRQELIARATTEPAGTGGAQDAALVLTVKWVKSGKVAGEDQFLLKGNQWMLEGNILKWSAKLNLLGLHTLQKVGRVRGRYLIAQDEMRLPATVYDINGGTDRLWLLL